MKALLKVSIYQPLFNLLVFLIWLMPGNSLGLAIIALTVIIRIIFLPSMLKQGASQEKLRILQPKIKDLQARHKGDKTAQSKALIDLYKEAGTSPWGACLPVIAQMVVLLLLYKVFQIGLTTARFDLLYDFVPRPSEINTLFFGIDLSKPDLWILPIIAGVFQFIQSKLSMGKPSKDADNPMMTAMSQVMYVLPVMTVFIGRKFPAALVIYWITTSIFMILQQLYINRFIKPRIRQQLGSMKIESTKPVEKPAKSEEVKAIAGKGVSVSIRKRK